MFEKTSGYEPHLWPLGQTLIVASKITFPTVSAAAADHWTPYADDMRDGGQITLFPPERCQLIRTLNHGKHAICKHAGTTLFIASTKHLSPL